MHDDGTTSLTQGYGRRTSKDYVGLGVAVAHNSVVPGCAGHRNGGKSCTTQVATKRSRAAMLATQYGIDIREEAVVSRATEWIKRKP